MSGRAWTAAEVATLRAVVAEGGDLVEAAGELPGRTLRAVRLKSLRLGQRLVRLRKRPDADRRARLMAALARGLTLKAAADLLGVKPPSVHDMVGRLVADGLLRRVGDRYHGRYVPTRAWTAEPGDEAAVLNGRGRSVGEVADALGLPKTTAWRRARAC